MPLNPSVHEFLVRLDRAHLDGALWVSIEDVLDIPGGSRTEAARQGYVEARGSNNTRQYRLSSLGRAALGDHAEHQLHELRGEPAANGRIKSLVKPYPRDSVVDQVVAQAQTDPDDDPSLIFGDPEISVSLYGETLGADEPEPHIKTCVEPGCTEPRYKKYNRCEQHAKAYLNRQKTASNPAPVRIAEPATTEADTQPVRIPVDTTPPLIRIAARAAVNLIVLRSRLAGSR